MNISVKKEIFKRIEKGEITEVYCDIKPYWCKKFANAGCMYKLPTSESGVYLCQMKGIKCNKEAKELPTEITIRSGRSKSSVTRQITAIGTGHGKPEWGAKESEAQFIVRFNSNS